VRNAELEAQAQTTEVGNLAGRSLPRDVCVCGEEG
jgi:hypothetical protein